MAFPNFNKHIFSSFKSFLRLSSTSSVSSSDSKRYVLEYSYVADILEKRGPYRTKHLELLETLIKEQKLLGAGPWSPPSGAMFLFKSTSSIEAEQFVKDDPYVAAGLVTSYTIKEWTKVVGIDNI